MLLSKHYVPITFQQRLRIYLKHAWLKRFCNEGITAKDESYNFKYGKLSIYGDFFDGKA